LICVLVAFVTLALAHPREGEFRMWMKKYEKKYESENEYLRRFIVFLDNIDKIKELNKNNDNVTYGLNNLADYTHEEFSSLLGMKGYVPRNLENVPKLENFPIGNALASFDWCSAGHCTGVKDQGQCGSCWAFATAENIESVSSIGGRGLPTLSPQQIVDCDSGEQGCGGGDPAQAYGYVVQQGGLDTESSYPYQAVQGSCKFNPSTIGAKISGSSNGYGGSENQMAANLAGTAPFSIIVDASSWQFYNGGILSSCGQNLDHAVIAAGYNTGSGFWRVRNSWGGGWGEGGYIRLKFGQNTCGMTTEVLTARL